MWRIACYCGAVFDCVPPATCPKCGVPVTDGRSIGTIDAWLQSIRDEIGATGTTSWDSDHERW